jgi:hypothetical protein
MGAGFSVSSPTDAVEKISNPEFSRVLKLKRINLNCGVEYSSSIEQEKASHYSAVGIWFFALDEAAGVVSGFGVSAI